MRRRDSGYGCYADLAVAQVEGADFSVCVQRRPESPIAILAPHGGGIEAGTSEIARAVAGSEFNLYLFEGIRPAGNYDALHLTSHVASRCYRPATMSSPSTDAAEARREPCSGDWISA